MSRLVLVLLALAGTLALAAPAGAVDRVPARRGAPPPPPATTDTTPFVADSTDTAKVGVEAELLVRLRGAEEPDWWHLPNSRALLTPPEIWSATRGTHPGDVDLVLDYNRVDQLRMGVTLQHQRPLTTQARLAGRWEYALGRKRALYGVQLEQPLQKTARVVAGLEADRHTEHDELQQVSDEENTLLLLLAREDWRDYFEREGAGAYVSWRVPDFSTVTVRYRQDQWRSLVARPHVVSWIHDGEPLRDNPAIDDGATHAITLSFDRLAHHTRRSRGGLYHWIEFERAGQGLGGDFDYTRALADLRSVVRLTPGASLSLRAVGGGALRGTPPLQRQFTLGGVDGLRAHAFGAFRGDRLALGQAEVSTALPTQSARRVGGLQMLAFVDSGTAWKHEWRDDIVAQHFAVDAGVGISTAEDDLRLTVAQDLQDSSHRPVWAVRLQRPF